LKKRKSAKGEKGPLCPREGQYAMRENVRQKETGKKKSPDPQKRKKS